MWVPVTTAQRVLGLCVEETASRYEGSRGQSTSGDPSTWWSGDGLTTHRTKTSFLRKVTQIRAYEDTRNAYKILVGKPEGTRPLGRPIWKDNIRMVKVKIKLPLCLTKHHAMKTYWGSGGIAPRILDLGIRWRWVVSFTHRPLYPQGKSRWYPLDRRLGGPQSRSGCGGEQINSQPVAQRYTDWAVAALNIRMDRRETVGKCGLDASDSGQGPVAGSCKRGNEPSGAMKGGGFLGKLSDCQVVKKDSAPWS
jgi:hypothetical protein